MQRKIILFELNEVPSRVLDAYCAAKPDSELALLVQHARRFETLTEDVGSLSPWITWPSLHRGVNNERHLLGDFGQSTADADGEYPSIWQFLSDSDVPVGVCGSLHSYPLPEHPERYAFYLPDTFAAGSECFPEVLDSFQAFNLAMARESARNVDSRIPWSAALRLLASVPRLGFKPATMIDVARQLIDERLTPPRVVRRRTYQSVLAFDVFMHQLVRTQPAFATFFTNHVASAMHRYWAAAFPEDYAETTHTPEWIRTYRDEIFWCMDRASDMLGRLRSFVTEHPEYTIWVATSMGQEATVARACETQLYVTDAQRLMTALGFPQGSWQSRPAMLPQFNVAVAPQDQETLVSNLAKFAIDGQPVSCRVSDAGFVSMDFGHPNLADPVLVTLSNERRSAESIGLTNIEIQDKSGTSAYHIPQGCLIVFDPRLQRTDAGTIPSISSLEIAPAILRNFGIPAPGYMARTSRAFTA